MKKTRIFPSHFRESSTIPVISTNQPKTLLRKRKQNLNSDIQSFLNENTNQNLPNISLSPKTNETNINHTNNSLTTIQQSKTKRFTKPLKKIVNIHLYQVKPFSQHMLLRLRSNKNIMNNNTCLDNLSTSNLNRTNDIKYRKHIHSMSECFVNNNKLMKRGIACKSESTLKSISRDNVKQASLMFQGENYFKKQFMPILNKINCNNYNNNNKNAKEKFLKYIERNLKQSRKLYVQNNISSSRGNRQKIRKSYDPQQT